MVFKTIVVDLDGTLLRSDMLLETANRLAGRSPVAILQLAGWLATERASLREQLARATDIDPSLLPYHEPLLNWLRTEKEQGARLVLATASNELLASRVAAHLGIFDDVLASNATINLKLTRKREALVEKLGSRGFVYVGNDKPDLTVWQVASGVVTVSDSARLGHDSEKANKAALNKEREKNQQLAKDLRRNAKSPMKPRNWPGRSDGKAGLLATGTT